MASDNVASCLGLSECALSLALIQSWLETKGLALLQERQQGMVAAVAYVA